MLETKPRNIFKRLENTSAKPTTIQDLQIEINNLKMELKELHHQQEIHQIILSHLGENSDSESVEKDIENENLEDEMFMGLINKIKIQKFYINIRIIINDFVLDTMTLFDTGADLNCILEGLIPTKFFEKTSEKLSIANGSKLKTYYKLSSAIIENQGLKINKKILLVKNLKNEIILGTPFIRALQLEKPQLKEKIQTLLQHIQLTICSNLPHAFWNRKKHINISRTLQTLRLTILHMNSYRQILMPPKASGTPLRGGRSTSKGFKLALPKPTIKKRSSTQIVTIKPESSTQECPKPSTTKQTKADNAFSIQTLQALQEMGLTKLPKLAKKT
ncbi:hypothetical protein GmHk_03G006814 [Glycine max]|nr:hypothetical protein GmHk_03G006814 [Glycine max]